MKELLPGSDSLANRISFFHIVLLMVSLPFDMFYSHVILASYGVHTLIQLKKENIKPIFTKRVLAVQAIFFVTVIATIYTAFPQQAFNEWGRDIVVLILPLLFCLNTLDITKYRPLLLLGFAVCCVLTVVYLYANALLTISFYHLPLTKLFSPEFTNHNFAQPINMHATFFSMQLVIGLVTLIPIMVSKSRVLLKTLAAIGSLILLAGLIQLTSKAILAVLFLTFIITVPYILFTGRNRIKAFAAAIVLTAAIVMLIAGNTTFKVRYFNTLQADLSTQKPGYTSEERLARWELAWSLVRSSPIIGHGAGSEIPLLGEQFYANKVYISYLAKLNAHNQYLSLLIKSGILGLAVYLLVLVYGFRIAIARRDLVFISFMLLIAVVSLSENVLDVDKGIFFYGFFFTFLLFSYPAGEAAKNINKKYNCLNGLATN